MEQNITSGLKQYSLGIVIEDKKEGTDIILVDPVESFTLDHGKIKDDSRKYESKLKDHRGIERKDKLTGGSVIKAKWIPYGESNRETAPDVYKNETVMLFRFANEPDLYWTTIFREPLIRRLETVIYTYSNKPSGLSEYDPNSSYWEKWDTRRKVIHRHTSDNDGEPFKWDIVTNAKEGWHQITSDEGDLLRIDAKAVTNTLKNSAGTSITQNRDNLYMRAPSQTVIQSPRIVLDGSVTITGNLTVGGGIRGTHI